MLAQYKVQTPTSANRGKDSDGQLLEANSSLSSNLQLLEKSYETTVIEEQHSVQQYFQNDIFMPAISAVNTSKTSNSNLHEKLANERPALVNNAFNLKEQSEVSTIPKESTNGQSKNQILMKKGNEEENLELKEKRPQRTSLKVEKLQQELNEKPLLREKVSQPDGSNSNSEQIKSRGPTNSSAVDENAKNVLLDESSRQYRDEEVSVGEKNYIKNPFQMLLKHELRESEEEHKADFRETANFEPILKQKNDPAGPERSNGDFGVYKANSAYYLNEIRETQSEYQGDEDFRKSNEKTTMRLSKQAEEQRHLKFNLQVAGNYSMNELGRELKMIGLEKALEQDTEDTQDYTQIALPIFKNMHYQKGADQSISLNLSKIRDDSISYCEEKKEIHETSLVAKLNLIDDSPNKSKALSKITPSSENPLELRLNEANIISRSADVNTPSTSQKNLQADSNVVKKAAVVQNNGNILDELEESKGLADSVLGRQGINEKIVYEETKEIRSQNNPNQRAPSISKGLSQRDILSEGAMTKTNRNRGEVDFADMKLDLSGIQQLDRYTLEELEVDQTFTSRTGDLNTKRSAVGGIGPITTNSILVAGLRSDSIQFIGAESPETLNVNNGNQPQEKPKSRLNLNLEELVTEQNGAGQTGTHSQTTTHQESARRGPYTSFKAGAQTPKYRDGKLIIPEKMAEILDGTKFRNEILERISKLKGFTSLGQEISFEAKNRRAAQNSQLNINTFNTSQIQQSFSRTEANRVVEEFFKDAVVIRSEGPSVEVERKTPRSTPKNVKPSFQRDRNKETTFSFADTVSQPHSRIQAKESLKGSGVNEPKINSDNNLKLPLHEEQGHHRRCNSGLSMRNYMCIDQNTLPKGRIGFGSVTSLSPRHQFEGPNKSNGLSRSSSRSTLGADRRFVSSRSPWNRFVETKEYGFLSGRETRRPSHNLLPPSPSSRISSHAKTDRFGVDHPFINRKGSNINLDPTDSRRQSNATRGLSKLLQENPMKLKGFEQTMSSKDTLDTSPMISSQKTTPTYQELAYSQFSPSLANQGFRNQHNLHHAQKGKVSSGTGYDTPGSVVSPASNDSYSQERGSAKKIPSNFAKANQCELNSSPRNRTFKMEAPASAFQTKIEGYNQNILNVVLRLHESLQRLGKDRVTPQFSESCKKLVKVAREIVVEDTDSMLIREKLQEFDKIFNPLSKRARDFEVGLLFYLQRMFVSLQEKADTLETIHKEKEFANDWQEQRKTSDRELQHELEICQYESSMLREIQQNDAKNARHFGIKHEVERISQIHSGIAPSRTISEKSDDTTESQVASYDPHRKSQSNREALRLYFYREAVNIKQTLPAGHPGREYPVSDLYDECVEQHISKEGFVDFIKEKYSLL